MNGYNLINLCCLYAIVLVSINSCSGEISTVTISNTDTTMGFRYSLDIGKCDKYIDYFIRSGLFLKCVYNKESVVCEQTFDNSRPAYMNKKIFGNKHECDTLSVENYSVDNNDGYYCNPKTLICVSKSVIVKNGKLVNPTVAVKVKTGALLAYYLHKTFESTNTELRHAIQSISSNLDKYKNGNSIINAEKEYMSKLSHDKYIDPRIRLEQYIEYLYKLEQMPSNEIPKSNDIIKAKYMFKSIYDKDLDIECKSKKLKDPLMSICHLTEVGSSKYPMSYGQIVKTLKEYYIKTLRSDNTIGYNTFANKIHNSDMECFINIRSYIEANAGTFNNRVATSVCITHIIDKYLYIYADLNGMNVQIEQTLYHELEYCGTLFNKCMSDNNNNYYHCSLYSILQ